MDSLKLRLFIITAALLATFVAHLRASQQQQNNQEAAQIVINQKSDLLFDVSLIKADQKAALATMSCFYDKENASGSIIATSGDAHYEPLLFVHAYQQFSLMPHDNGADSVTVKIYINALPTRQTIEELIAEYTEWNCQVEVQGEHDAFLKIVVPFAQQEEQEPAQEEYDPNCAAVAA